MLALEAASAGRQNQNRGHLILKTPNAISTRTTCSRNHSRAAFTRPPASAAKALAQTSELFCSRRTNMRRW